MKDQSAQIRAALERTHVMSDWPQAAVDEICAEAESRTFGDGERVVSAGDLADTVWIVTEGSFLLSKSWQNGRRFLFSYLRPGQTSGILPVFDGRPAAFDITARGGGSMIAISGRALRVAAARHPDVAMELIADLCRNTRADYEAIELHAMNSVRCRIAKAILWIARGQGKSSASEIVVDSRISQEDLADIVCAARQSVNRELRRMMKEGILKQRYRTLVILDRERLTRVAEEDEDVPPQPRNRVSSAPHHLYPTTD
jgi:CRP-like cAMP-binding protein